MGPDGWLWGCHGIQDESRVGVPGTPDEKRTKIRCSIWRYHPTRKVFEVICHGTTNPWGLDFDEHGQAFFSNSVIGHFWHVIPGARFKRMYGQDYNPYTYRLINEVSDHLHWPGGKWGDSRKQTANVDRMGGGHAHCGAMIYQGDNWPDEYRGSVFMGNVHGRRLNHDLLERKGCGYVAKHGKDFLHSSDPWFRIVAVKSGPDGGVFFTDWSDQGECHDNDGVHRSSGRIYKVVYGEPRRPGQ